ncbi:MULTISPECIES: hypothetical protein [unclassified Rathayibacter]|uniref:hypothetical protein n=1 Tax=unclassified Rathayibacter TaxID=2609250 RepID=UPI00104321CB|nr:MULTISPECIES: hypothetical protein [unclassified Rathayibacter]MCJ1675518.1 hypothetical protein [Rathayibacter sp. VKM Ac-2929]TCL79470.1 hypothetical protein EDF49_111106 [Rathayibacter sp. PhB192]TCM25261.1 hypothetical protein EDF43_11189 [Rathayibacter sp. PhB179]
MGGYGDDPFGTGEPAAAAASVDVAAGEESTHIESANEFVRKQLIGTYRRGVMAQGSGGRAPTRRPG